MAPPSSPRERARTPTQPRSASEREGRWAEQRPPAQPHSHSATRASEARDRGLDGGEPRSPAPREGQGSHRALQDPALVEHLRRTIQPDGVRVLNALAGAGEGTDEKIAELSGVNLYLVRKILYILYEMRLTEYRRQRNEENGWLTYHWTVNWREVEAHLAREVRKLARSLSVRLEHERGNLFYSCPQEGSRLLFDTASEAQFKCPQCGATLQAVDNQARVAAMEARLEELVQAWPGALDGED